MHVLWMTEIHVESDPTIQCTQYVLNKSMTEQSNKSKDASLEVSMTLLLIMIPGQP